MFLMSLKLLLQFYAQIKGTGKKVTKSIKRGPKASKPIFIPSKLSHSERINQMIVQIPFYEFEWIQISQLKVFTCQIESKVKIYLTIFYTDVYDHYYCMYYLHRIRCANFTNEQDNFYGVYVLFEFMHAV